MTEEKRQSVVLCEGFYDRAFWAGWLKHLGCKDPGEANRGGNRRPVLDPWGSRVAAGEFGFRSGSNKFIRIVPCHGKSKLLDQLRDQLKAEREQASQNPACSRLSRLVVAVEPDTMAGSDSPKTGLRTRDLFDVARQIDPKAAQNDRGDISLFSGATSLSLVRWVVVGQNCAGVPSQQTLERLVCSALVAAFPERAVPIQTWLDGRPHAPAAGPKEFVWSHMAGWYAEQGCQEFFSYLWQAQTGNGRIREELEKRLRACGAWRVAEALAQ